MLMDFWLRWRLTCHCDPNCVTWISSKSLSIINWVIIIGRHHRQRGKKRVYAILRFPESLFLSLPPRRSPETEGKVEREFRGRVGAQRNSLRGLPAKDLRLTFSLFKVWYITIVLSIYYIFTKKVHLKIGRGNLCAPFVNRSLLSPRRYFQWKEPIGFRH